MTGSTGRRSTGTNPPLRVLFVCTANISRSPYAERRARQALAAVVDAGLGFGSAGTPGLAGRRMDPAMESLLLARGGDASGHISRQVDQAILERADLVVVFEFAHHMRLLDAFPHHGDVIVGLHQAVLAIRSLDEPDTAGARELDVAEQVERLVAAAPPNSMSFDVEDPYGRGLKAARACADEIDQLLDVLLPYLAGRDLPALAVPMETPEIRRPRWPWGRRLP